MRMLIIVDLSQSWLKKDLAGKIYCTPATRDLTVILMEILQRYRRVRSNMRIREGLRMDLPYLQPLYTIGRCKECGRLFCREGYGQWFDVMEGVQVMFTDAGHIIGSACVHLKITENGKKAV